MLILSSSSMACPSPQCHMLLCDCIFKYSSGLLSITQLFSMRPLKGLISMARPKDLQERQAKLLPAISVLVAKTYFQACSDLGSLPSMISVKDRNDFLDARSTGSTFSLYFFLGAGEGEGSLVSSSLFSSSLIFLLTRGRSWGLPLRKKGWLKIFLLGSLRDL